MILGECCGGCCCSPHHPGPILLWVTLLWHLCFPNARICSFLQRPAPGLLEQLCLPWGTAPRNFSSCRQALGQEAGYETLTSCLRSRDEMGTLHFRGALWDQATFPPPGLPESHTCLTSLPTPPTCPIPSESTFLTLGDTQISVSSRFL